MTAHAYDIYLEPRNLGPKLEEAAFSTSGCEYTVRDLERIGGTEVHEIIMGVDTARVRRSRPHAGGRRVVSVGRLVEKKGFADLIDAAALIRDQLDEVVIVGDGPLRDELEARIASHGLRDVVRLAGAAQPAAVLDLVEDADVFALACVVAANGDRDSMPVVVKEALALEVPVVVTDEVGLPELVRPEFGALVPPHDPSALAKAISAMLALPLDQRKAMGRRGREFVAQRCNVDTETAKLAALIDAASR